MTLRRLPVALLLFGTCVSAVHAASAPAAELPSSSGSVLQMLFGLLVVLGSLFGLLMLLRRLQMGRTHLAGGLRIIGATSVGPRERVVLLGVGTQVLVLGVTQGRIKTLHTLPASELPPETASLPPPTADFAARLRQLLEKRHVG